ncbi:MAG TPA: response regulator [Ktedonobacterales bacterium]
MRVLVVDDDAGIRDTLNVMLREEGYEVCEAANGIEALQQIRAATEPMVVLLDMWMPHMTGEETLMAVLAQGTLWARVSFIVMTANPQRMTARAHTILESYGIPLFVKPFDIDPLAELVAARAEEVSRVAMRRA